MIPASPAALRHSYQFLENIREVYRIVIDGPLSGIWVPGPRRSQVFVIGRNISGSSRGHPAKLSNGKYLNVEITLRERQLDSRLETARSTFTYQAGSSTADQKEIFSYHYDRDAKYPRPRAHLHIEAAPEHGETLASFSRAHLPVRRITLEQIIWVLIHDFDVEPTDARRDDWENIVWRNERRFLEAQKARDWPYDPPFPERVEHFG